MGDAEFGSWTRLSGDLERSLDLSRDLSLELERREGITSYRVICVHFRCEIFFEVVKNGKHKKSKEEHTIILTCRGRLVCECSFRCGCCLPPFG